MTLYCDKEIPLRLKVSEVAVFPYPSKIDLLYVPSASGPLTPPIPHAPYWSANPSVTPDKLPSLASKLADARFLGIIPKCGVRDTGKRAAVLWDEVTVIVFPTNDVLRMDGDRSGGKHQQGYLFHSFLGDWYSSYGPNFVFICMTMLLNRDGFQFDSKSWREYPQKQDNQYPKIRV